MAQVFPPVANVIARASLFGAVAAPVVLILLGSGITRSPANTKVEVPLDQPVPFSHEHHVSELGIDCRYCHTTVEKGPSAGIPPTQTCMSCHSQIWTNSPLLEPIRESYKTDTPIKSSEGEVGWNRVNRLPDFVFFNHSIHVNRGINCNVCHGPVQKMQLTYKGNTLFMAWCLQCHRNPERALYQSPETKAKGLTPREQVFDLYWRAQEGEEKLTGEGEHDRPSGRRELAIVDGADFSGYNPSPEEVSEGEKLVDKLHIKKAQLTDCWTCHR